MGKNPPKWLPGDRVNETILLQRKSVDELRAEKSMRKDKTAISREKHRQKLDSKRKRKLETKKFISAQTLLKYAQRQKHQARTFHKIGEKVSTKMRKAGTEKLNKSFEHSRVALLVRCKGGLVPKDIRSAFGRLGLNKLYTARLIHVGMTNNRLLKQLKPFSIVGYPDDEQIEKLIRTRGCLWNEETKTKRFISGNRLLEEALGQFNVLCVEDLAAAITGKVPELDSILRNIAPFDFKPPRQLFLERHRSEHQRMEVVNPESFAAYLSEQLGTAAREAGVANRKKAAVDSALAKKIDAAKVRAAVRQAAVPAPVAAVQEDAPSPKADATPASKKRASKKEESAKETEVAAPSPAARRSAKASTSASPANRKRSRSAAE